MKQIQLEKSPRHSEVMDLSFNRQESDLRFQVRRKLNRQLAYCAQEVLIETIRRVQQHRGSVLGFLGNHSFFEENIQYTRERTNACFAILEDFDAVLAEEDRARLQDEWEAVDFISSTDTPKHQFELHCHLVDELIQCIWDMMCQNDVLFEEDAQIRQYNKVLIKYFLRLIEKTGQCRALATFISSQQTFDEASRDFQNKLTFLIKDLTEDLEMAYLEFSCLKKRLSDPVFTILSQYDCKHKLLKLQSLVEGAMLNTEEVSIETESVFYLFTTSMDELYNVFTKAMRVNLYQEDSRPVLF